MTKTCPNCHQPNLPTAAFCHNCASPLAAAPTVGAPPNQQQWQPQGGPVVGQPAPPPSAGASQRAMIALGLAIAALFCCGPLTGIPAAIVGWMELDSIKKGQSSEAGKWMAMVGLWGGIAFTVLHIVIYAIYVIFVMLATANPYQY
jgi:hypothetical protein